MTVIKKRKTEQPIVLEENWYPATLRKISSVKGEFSPCFRFSFSIDTVPNAEAAIVVSQDFFTKSKLDLLLKTLGYDIPNDTEFDTDVIANSHPKALILTEQQTGDNGTVYNNVVRAKPYKQINASVVPPVQAAPAPAPVAAPVAAAAPAAVPTAPVAAPVAAAAPAAVKPTVPAPAAPASYVENVEEIDFSS